MVGLVLKSSLYLIGRDKMFLHDKGVGKKRVGGPSQSVILRFGERKEPFRDNQRKRDIYCQLFSHDDDIYLVVKSLYVSLHLRWDFFFFKQKAECIYKTACYIICLQPFGRSKRTKTKNASALTALLRLHNLCQSHSTGRRSLT